MQLSSARLLWVARPHTLNLVKSDLIIQLGGRASRAIHSAQGVKDTRQHSTGCALTPGCLSVTAGQHFSLCLLFLQRLHTQAMLMQLLSCAQCYHEALTS